MKKRLELIMAVIVLVGAYFFAKEGAYMAESKKAEEGKICIVVDAGHGGADSASDKNNEGTRRKATVVPIKIEYV